MLCNPCVGDWPLPELAYGSHKSQDHGSILLPTPEPIANLQGFHVTIQGAVREFYLSDLRCQIRRTGGPSGSPSILKVCVSTNVFPPFVNIRTTISSALFPCLVLK